jgi:DNA-binding NtrC family response regulator
MTRSVRLLLVDDERVFADALSKVLGQRGLSVRTAYDGQTAVAAAAEERFDVIVLDLRMPGMDGVATLQAIREHGSLTPVLLLSGHADFDRARQALGCGATDFLLKPCPVDRLLAAIEDAHERAGYSHALN